jgi:hypothetical protein
VYVIRKFGEPTVVGSAALTAFVAAGVAGSLAGGWLRRSWPGWPCSPRSPRR